MVNEFLHRHRWTLVDWFFAALTLLVLAGFANWFILDVRDYIEVRHQQIKTNDKGVLMVEVDRSLWKNFQGSYSANIWQIDGSRWCSTGWVGPHPYRHIQADGSPVKLPDPTPLSWWVEGGNCADRAEGGTAFLRNLEVGRYELIVCHRVHWRFLSVPLHKAECWPTVPFVVTASAANAQKDHEPVNGHSPSPGATAQKQ